LKFQPGRGAPASIELPKLISLKDAREAGVKGFAGIMEYETEFEGPEELVKDPASRFVLSLGRLGESGVAEVELNGSSLGTLWIQPYELALEKALKAGRKRPAREGLDSLGEQAHSRRVPPEDCDRSGPHLKNYPEWLLKGEPRTSGHVWLRRLPVFQEGFETARQRPARPGRPENLSLCYSEITNTRRIR
jgi:hypothetical protein